MAEKDSKSKQLIAIISSAGMYSIRVGDFPDPTGRPAVEIPELRQTAVQTGQLHYQVQPHYIPGGSDSQAVVTIYDKPIRGPARCSDLLKHATTSVVQAPDPKNPTYSQARKLAELLAERLLLNKDAIVDF